MDKLTRYNQKLLAIIGTLVLIAIVIGFVAGTGGVIFSLIDSSDDQAHGLQVKQNAAAGDTTLIRTQEISFNQPIQLDSGSTQFLIPVGQVNLEKPTSVKFEGGSDSRLSAYYKSYRWQYGLFNNFALYDYETGQSKKIFDQRVAITRWLYLKKDAINVLLFKGSNNDDNGDQRIDEEDYQSLFVYYLKDQQLKKYDFEKRTVVDFEPMENTPLIALKIGVDKNGDFEFERRREPQEIQVLNLKSRAVKKIIPDPLRTEIQNIVDGMQ